MVAMLGSPSAAPRPAPDVRRWLAVIVSALAWMLATSGPAEAGNRLAALAALGMVAPMTPAPPPDFTLPTLDGGQVQLASLRGRVVLLSFWTTWCRPCILDMPGLQSVQQVLHRRGFVVVGVNVGEAPADVVAFARDLQLNFPVALDPRFTVAGRYGVTGVPATLLIDRDGRIVGRAVGSRDWTQDAALHLFLELLGEGGEVLR